MSNQTPPIVPHVLLVGEQHNPWRLAPIEQLKTLYHTPTTIVVDRGGEKVRLQQEAVYCLSSALEWDRAQSYHAELQYKLNTLAHGIATLGAYADKLAGAGGVKQAPNPLCDTVIHVPDPYLTEDAWYTFDLVPIPNRLAVFEHTPKMLKFVHPRESYISLSNQRDHFVCPDDAAWIEIQSLHAAAMEAARDWTMLLDRLCTYETALATNRYASPSVVITNADAIPADKSRIPIRLLRVDGGTQMRAAIDATIVAEYAQFLADGVEFPPLVAYYDGSEYWLADGFHRHAAYSLHDRSALIRVDVRSGTRRDAVLHAAGANATHGLRRTNADKRRAIETLLRDSEWQQWSDREIARRAGVSDKTVGQLRKELTTTAEIPQSAERRGADGRTIDTTQIGARPMPGEISIPEMRGVPPPVLECVDCGTTRHIVYPTSKSAALCHDCSNRHDNPSAPIFLDSGLTEQRARIRAESWLRGAFDTILRQTDSRRLRLIALGVCTESCARIADMDTSDVIELLIRRVIDGAWSGDTASLLHILETE